MKKYQLIMFDLDGTIADTSKGVINCVKYVREKMNLKQLDEEVYKKFIGPSNKESYAKFYSLQGEALQLALAYHKLYAVKRGIFEAIPYIGIEEVLKYLKDANIQAAVVTLKMQESTEKLLRHFQLNQYFDIVVGASENEKDKCGLINQCLDKNKISSKNALMIGDSKYDQIGAMKANVDFIGVTYGFGFHTEEDMKAMPYIAVAENVEKLYKLLEHEGEDRYDESASIVNWARREQRC